MQIRPATQADSAAIWSIIGPTIRAGETFALARDLSQQQAVSDWLGSDRETYVALEGERMVGTYYLRTNQPGGGSHVANCGYMTAAAASGRGVARGLCQHSLQRARARGFRALQFNFVVSSNERAVRLWQAMGFQIVGRLPGAFHHPTLGYVDALVMYQTL